jgi:hypothetical protein
LMAGEFLNVARPNDPPPEARACKQRALGTKPGRRAPHLMKSTDDWKVS